MKKLISAILGVLAPGVIQADDHGSGWLVDIGQGVSQSSHLCTLKGKATDLADVDKIDVKLHKWHDDNGVNIYQEPWKSRFSTGASTIPYDFIAVDWMTWETFGDGWDKFLTSSEGQSVFAAYNKIMDCTRVVGTIYPMFRKASARQDDQGVVTVNWCTRKDGVSQDSLIARHRTYRDGLK